MRFLLWLLQLLAFWLGLLPAPPIVRDAVLLFDAGHHPAITREIVAQIERLTPRFLSPSSPASPSSDRSG